MLQKKHVIFLLEVLRAPQVAATADMWQTGAECLAELEKMRDEIPLNPIGNYSETD